MPLRSSPYIPARCMRTVGGTSRPQVDLLWHQVAQQRGLHREVGRQLAQRGAQHLGVPILARGHLRGGWGGQDMHHMSRGRGSAAGGDAVSTRCTEASSRLRDCAQGRESRW